MHLGCSRPGGGLRSRMWAIRPGRRPRTLTASVRGDPIAARPEPADSIHGHRDESRHGHRRGRQARLVRSAAGLMLAVVVTHATSRGRADVESDPDGHGWVLRTRSGGVLAPRTRRARLPATVPPHDGAGAGCCDRCHVRARGLGRWAHVLGGGTASRIASNHRASGWDRRIAAHATSPGHPAGNRGRLSDVGRHGGAHSGLDRDEPRRCLAPDRSAAVLDVAPAGGDLRTLPTSRRMGSGADLDPRAGGAGWGRHRRRLGSVDERRFRLVRPGGASFGSNLPGPTGLLRELGGPISRRADGRRATRLRPAQRRARPAIRWGRTADPATGRGGRAPRGRLHHDRGRPRRCDEPDAPVPAPIRHAASAERRPAPGPVQYVVSLQRQAHARASGALARRGSRPRVRGLRRRCRLVRAAGLGARPGRLETGPRGVPGGARLVRPACTPEGPQVRPLGRDRVRRRGLDDFPRPSRMVPGGATGGRSRSASDATWTFLGSRSAPRPAPRSTGSSPRPNWTG